ncbi:hypothetical protein U9M48_021019 [Paspalum notatum var. saurae]|uniref:Secreted protein n=1 Tax=Paspalum notatum var. saurae TaxID=547442 RepID=A0AAQ3TGD1_PASNO
MTLGLWVWIPLLHVRSLDLFARPHLRHLLQLQHITSSSNNSDALNTVFFDDGLEACRPLRFCWRHHILFIDGIHTYLRFNEEALQLGLRRPSLPPAVRPFHTGSMHPWRLWHPPTSATSSATTKMTSSVQRRVFSSSLQPVRRVGGYMFGDLVVFHPSLKDLHVICAA